MKKEHKRLFESKLTRMFSLMGNGQLEKIEKIKQNGESRAVHEIDLIKPWMNGRPLMLVHKMHLLNSSGRRVQSIGFDEHYNFYPARERKFVLMSNLRPIPRYRLFSRAAKIDMEDLFKKMDLKTVEML